MPRRVDRNNQGRECVSSLKKVRYTRKLKGIIELRAMVFDDSSDRRANIREGTFDSGEIEDEVPISALVALVESVQEVPNDERRTQ